MTKKALKWLPVALWMLLIFLLSAQPASQSSSLSGGFIEYFLKKLYPGFLSLPKEQAVEIIQNLQYIIRKSAHAGLYFMLSSLSFIPLYEYKYTFAKKAIIAQILATGYAITDELHQLFIAGRSCEAGDVLIDSLGAFCAIVFLYVFTFIKKISKNRHFKI